jgi:hypothetical protein
MRLPVLLVCSAEFLAFAVFEAGIAANPAVGVKRPASTARTARLSPPDYRVLGLALIEIASSLYAGLRR